MNNRQPFDRHFIVSHELLNLLEWLVNHEQENIKKLIRCAVKHGFEIKNAPAPGAGDNEAETRELQTAIVNFLGLIDIILQDTVNEDDVEGVLQRSMIPALKNIDIAEHDSSSIATSVARATQAASTKTAAVDSKDIFCRELLRRWKPHKKAVIH